MPTSITIPTGQRFKSVEFGAAYSPSESFNPNNDLISQGSGILKGLDLTINTGPTPPEVTVAVGSFMQRGVIVKVTSPQLVQFPNPQVYPLYLVAENADEMSLSSVQYLFTTTPASDSVILAFWPTAPVTNAQIPGAMSLTELRDAISGISSLVIQRERLVALGGQTVFTIDPAKSYVVGANKLFVYRNGKKLENINDYSEDTPTQFTTLFGATVGDVFDLIIFQGSPPITSIALPNLTDVTGALANAIKDSLNLRASPASPSNPLATMADISGISGAVGALVKQEAVVVSGSFVTGSAPIVITGSAIAFTIPVTQIVAFDGWLTNYYHPSALNRRDGQIGLRLDGIDYWGTFMGSSGLGYYGNDGVTISRAFSLAAGVHNASLIVRSPSNFLTNVAPSVDNPAVLRILYTTPQAIISSILENISDTASGDFNVPGGAYVLVPAPILSYNQILTGDVEATLTATAQQNAGNKINTKVALVLDGVTTVVVGDVQVSATGVVHLPCGGTVIFPGVAPGPHTIQVAIAAGAVGGDAIIKRGVDSPLRLIARHT